MGELRLCEINLNFKPLKKLKQSNHTQKNTDDGKTSIQGRNFKKVESESNQLQEIEKQVYKEAYIKSKRQETVRQVTHFSTSQWHRNKLKSWGRAAFSV